MNKIRIKPATKNELLSMINQEISKYGVKCDLNHIDVSCVEDMNNLFDGSKFNGNISQWDVSHVKSMKNMFSVSVFNGDISKWNTSSVTDMNGMFFWSKFNGDISQWDVSIVKDMSFMLNGSPFNGDLSLWKPVCLESTQYLMFKDAEINNMPYWALIEDNEERLSAIQKKNSYSLLLELKTDKVQDNSDILSKRQKV